MNFEAITIDDCLVLHGFGYDTVLNSEGVIGFEKIKNSEHGLFHFGFMRRPKGQCRGIERSDKDPRDLLLRARINV